MNIKRRTQRHNRIRAKVKGTADRPRASVFRSNGGLIVQIIDDVAGKTLVAVHGFDKKKHTKVEHAALIGKEVAELSKKEGINQIVFDRGGYQYHGRIKALAEAMREHGLSF